VSIGARPRFAVGAVERVSAGLLCTKIGLQPVGREMLAAGDRVETRR
jgi:hypothetical protein